MEDVHQHRDAALSPHSSLLPSPLSWPENRKETERQEQQRETTLKSDESPYQSHSPIPQVIFWMASFFFFFFKVTETTNSRIICVSRYILDF